MSARKKPRQDGAPNSKAKPPRPAVDAYDFTLALKVSGLLDEATERNSRYTRLEVLLLEAGFAIGDIQNSIIKSLTSDRDKRVVDALKLLDGLSKKLNKLEEPFIAARNARDTAVTP